jgi:hypothetical protein
VILGCVLRIWAGRSPMSLISYLLMIGNQIFLIATDLKNNGSLSSYWLVDLCHVVQTISRTLPTHNMIYLIIINHVFHDGCFTFIFMCEFFFGWAFLLRILLYVFYYVLLRILLCSTSCYRSHGMPYNKQHNRSQKNVI